MFNREPPFGSNPFMPPEGRRPDVAALLASLTSGASLMRDPRGARQRFEEELRSALQARSVVIREDTMLPPPPNVICIAIPLGAGDLRARLEAVFDAPRAIDDWATQMMEAASHVAAILIEVERAGAHLVPAQARRQADGAAPLIGCSDAIRRVRDRIERVAATDFTVLVEGESGTGKELVARQIHELSRRRRGPFVAVNCAAIVETLLEAELFGIEDRTATGVRGRRGKFEHAHEGTLFLDEVSDLSAAAQAKLLRAIQDLVIERVGGSGSRRVDTRMSSPRTNRWPGWWPTAGSGWISTTGCTAWRSRCPPCGIAVSDVIELAQYFLERHRGLRAMLLSEAAVDALLAYHWPGNVRELERVMERAIALANSDRLEVGDLPPALLGGYEDIILPSLRRRDTMREWGSRYARLVLERCRNNKRRACRELGISYHTLQAYLRCRSQPRSPAPDSI